MIHSFIYLHLQDFISFLRVLIKWGALAGLIGVLSGTASAIFLVSLDWATQTRIAQPALLFGLPLAGLILGWVYHTFGSLAAGGSALVIEQVNAELREDQPVTRVPLRMAPLVLVGTVITHLFGGSAGREGTAVQMGASLADGVRRLLRLKPEDRRLILMAGISGGFASVFGTPAAGFVFGMEVQHMGRIRYEGLVPCLVAACVGDLVTRAWGVGHTHYPQLAHLPLDTVLLAKVSLAGIAFGLAAVLFIELTHGIKALLKRVIAFPPLRYVVGGITVIALTLLLGTEDYLGLGIPLIQASVSGDGVPAAAFLFKIILTAVTLGSGFIGGEVTPLFVIGSTLGFTLSGLLGVDAGLLASIGFVAVFAGASNTPLACTLMGIEVFGGGAPIYLLVGCAVAYLASGHRGIYVSQRVGTPKPHAGDVRDGERLQEIAERRMNGRNGGMR